MYGLKVWNGSGETVIDAESRLLRLWDEGTLYIHQTSGGDAPHDGVTISRTYNCPALSYVPVLVYDFDTIKDWGNACVLEHTVYTDHVTFVFGRCNSDTAQYGDPELTLRIRVYAYK